MTILSTRPCSHSAIEQAGVANGLLYCIDCTWVQHTFTGKQLGWRHSIRIAGSVVIKKSRSWLLTAKNVEERRCKFFNFLYVIAVKSFRNTKICFNRIAGNANEFAFLYTFVEWFYSPEQVLYGLTVWVMKMSGDLS